MDHFYSLMHWILICSWNPFPCPLLFLSWNMEVSTPVFHRSLEIGLRPILNLNSKRVCSVAHRFPSLWYRNYSNKLKHLKREYSPYFYLNSNITLHLKKAITLAEIFCENKQFYKIQIGCCFFLSDQSNIFLFITGCLYVCMCVCIVSCWGVPQLGGLVLALWQ